MGRVLKGLFFGIAIGALLAWLYQRYLCPPETIPARAVPAAAPPDDLVTLHGIGPAFAQRLLEAGIRTYADLAQLTPEQVADLVQVPVWRIRRDDWIGQAAARMQ